MLMNLETLTWDDELLEIMGVPRAMLPTHPPQQRPRLLRRDLLRRPLPRRGARLRQPGRPARRHRGPGLL